LEGDKMADKILFEKGRLQVPDSPIIPYIQGDGIGVDIWKNAQLVFDKAVEKAYGGQRKVVWKEVLAGKKAAELTGDWLPEETLATNKDCLVAIITFHSLEDRIVKERFKKWANSCICPPGVYRCECGNNHELGEILTKKPLTASQNELKINSRSKSAKLRVFKIKG